MSDCAILNSASIVEPAPQVVHCDGVIDAPAFKRRVQGHLWQMPDMVEIVAIMQAQASRSRLIRPPFVTALRAIRTHCCTAPVTVRQAVAVRPDAFLRRAPVARISPVLWSSATRGLTLKTLAPIAAAASSALSPAAPAAVMALNTRSRSRGTTGAMAWAASLDGPLVLKPGVVG